MRNNIFLDNPPKVVIYDPIAEQCRRAFVFLGDVPKSIWNACHYYHTVTQGQRSAYDRILKEYYGAAFKVKLGLDIKDPKRAWIFKKSAMIELIGGNEESPYTETGQFTHAGHRYDIGCMFQTIADYPIIQAKTSDLEWILREMPDGYFDEPTEAARVEIADITTPITITQDMGRYVVIDGIHRLKKAVMMGLDTLPSKEIGAAALAHCRATEGAAAEWRQGSDEEVDYSDIEALLETAPKSIIGAPTTVSLEEGIEYITEVQFFPEDRFNEAKEKIFVATGIPTYRQHVFYIDHNILRSVYQIHAEGIYNVDIRQISSFRDNIHGIPIDKTLYDLRSQIKIEALDTFKILGESLAEDNVIYIVDLAQFVTKARSQLLEVINDTYQYELLYFGLVIKYWPQLTRECFYDYMVNESELQHKYPDLAKSKSILANIYKAERDIVTVNYKNMTRALSMCGVANVPIAITQMIASVTNTGVLLNIRNLFDKLRTTRCIPEIHAYVEHNNKKYMLRKRHIKNGSDIQFASGAIMKNGLTIAISLRKSDQDVFHNKGKASTIENEQSRYMFLNIWPTGKYYIKTIWNEEDDLGFDDIIKTMKKFTDPIINGINNLGRAVFMAGSKLELISRQNIDYQSLNICIFWKKVMLESTFKAVRDVWDTYLRAQIIGQRNVQQFDRYEFLFRKGMHEFDTTAIDRIITASNNIQLSNHYSYLSNNTVKQKWIQNYDGRIVRMVHRTVDIKFEVLDIREREFQIFYHYMVAFIYRAANDEKVRKSIHAIKSYHDVKKLKKLREQDPELYNLRKHGSDKVYSKICQNQRQPLIYTQDEMKDMPAEDVKKLTKYWNFTLNKPAYYGCPSKKYPHLSFIAGSHPKHYCLPCCNKKAQDVESSGKARINVLCLKQHIVEDSELAADSISRHIMGYGKDIDLGRLSRLPNSAIRGLLFDTLPGELGYYLYGVPQNVPGAEYVGFLYSVAEALEMSIEELAGRMSAALRAESAQGLFNVLLNGTMIEYFYNIRDLADTIDDLFVRAKMFSKEIQPFKRWGELFNELLRLLFEVTVFTFVDDSGAGDIVDLYVANSARNEALYHIRMGGQIGGEQAYVFLMKRRNQCYPIFAIDVLQYFRLFKVNKRRFTVGDKIVQLAFNMIKYGSQEDDLKIDKPVDLALIKAFVGDSTRYKITLKYINHRNMCYGVLVGDGGETIYMPVEYSVHTSDGIPISFTVFNNTSMRLSYESLAAFLAALNEYIRNSNSTYKLVNLETYFTIDGEIAGAISTAGVMFYFADYPAAQSAKVSTISLSHNYTEINRRIIERAAPVLDKRTTGLGEALYNNYIYQLFVIEYVNYLNNDRNTELRAKIRDLITTTDFRKDLKEFRRILRELLVDYPNDYNVVQHQLITFYYTFLDKNALLAHINDHTYEFDRVTMNRLKKLDRPALLQELETIAENFSVQQDIDTTSISFPNIYTTCSDVSENNIRYCAQNRLIVNRPIREFIDLLATDLMDPLKSKYLLNSLMDITIDWLKFTRHPTEIITIYRLTD